MSSSVLSPSELYEETVASNFKKTKTSKNKIFVSAVLAGCYISLGGLIYTLTITQSKLGFGPTKILGGITFSLGLILVMIAGAQLFTGNVLLWAVKLTKKVSLKTVLENWGLVYLGNLVGALVVVGIVYFSGIYGYSTEETSVGLQALSVTQSKLEHTNLEIFMRGILANWLVCLAVYLCYSTKDLIGKVVGIVFPVAAFVAIGAEHSIANMFLLPIGYLLKNENFDISLLEILRNLLFSTLGNIVGGGLFVATLYHYLFKRK